MSWYSYIFKNLLRLNLLPQCNLSGGCPCAVKKNMHTVPFQILNSLTCKNFTSIYLHPTSLQFFLYTLYLSQDNLILYLFFRTYREQNIVLNTLLLFLLLLRFSLLCFLFFGGGILLILFICAGNFRWSHVTQVGLELAIKLNVTWILDSPASTTKYWNYRCVSPLLVEISSWLPVTVFLQVAV